MGLFLVLLWCAAVVLGGNSRFGGFNSRLCPNKFAFPPLRELASKGLIWLAVFAAKTAVIGKNLKNSRFHGNNREFCPQRRERGGAQLRPVGSAGSSPERYLPCAIARSLSRYRAPTAAGS
jgi:hypothetical protein